MMMLIIVPEIFLVGFIVFCSNNIGAISAIIVNKITCFDAGRDRLWPLML